MTEIAKNQDEPMFVDHDVFCGCDIYNFSVVDSTNLLAARLSKYYSKNSFVVSSDLQLEGVGSFGRSWFSVLGNLFCSIAIKVSCINDKSSLTQLALVAAIAVGSILNNKYFSNSEFGVLYKWPNDLMLEGKKVCGVLPYLVGDYIIVGIGLNICSKPSHINASCLLDYISKPVVKKELLYSIVRRFLLLYKEWKEVGLSSFVDLWNCSSYYSINDLITVKDIKGGYYQGVDEKGNLMLLEHEIDCLHKVCSGYIM